MRTATELEYDGIIPKGLTHAKTYDVCSAQQNTPVSAYDLISK